MSRNIAKHKKNNNTATEKAFKSLTSECSNCFCSLLLQLWGKVPVLVCIATNAPPTAVAVASMHLPCSMSLCSGSSRLCSQFEIKICKKLTYLQNQNKSTKTINSNQYKASHMQPIDVKHMQIKQNKERQLQNTHQCMY